MLCCKIIERGFLYYAATRRREEVQLSSALRDETVSCLKEMRELYERKYTPKVKTSAKCPCSWLLMKDICLPKLQKYKSAREYTDTIWNNGGEE